MSLHGVGSLIHSLTGHLSTILLNVGSHLCPKLLHGLLSSHHCKNSGSRLARIIRCPQGKYCLQCYLVPVQLLSHSGLKLFSQLLAQLWIYELKKQHVIQHFLVLCTIVTVYIHLGHSAGSGSPTGMSVQGVDEDSQSLLCPHFTYEFHHLICVELFIVCG